MQNGKLRVFLSASAGDPEKRREFLYNVLKKAELEVICLENNEGEDKETLQNKIRQAVAKADCSIHIIDGGNSNSDENSITEIQLIEAKNYSRNAQNEFRIFIWQPVHSEPETNSGQQEKFLASIKNSILQNITISNHLSPVGFVEDLYAVMNTEKTVRVETQESDVFLINNELDDDYTAEISDLLEDVLHVVRLSVSQNSGREHASFIVEQARHSRMVVVFFKWSQSWIQPFLQQLWRMLGGASFGGKILVVSDSEAGESLGNMMPLPNIEIIRVAQELIPLEIKVRFDQMTNP